MNIANYLQRSAQAWPDGTALALGDAPRATWRQMLRKVAVMATHLRGRFGLAPGERVALVTSNRPESLEAMCAIWHAGLAAVPINAKLHAKEIAHILADSGARLVFVTSDVAETVAEAVADTPQKVVLVDVEGADWRRMAIGDPTRMERVAPDDLAWLFYTSGTTGRPKGAQLTHRNLMAMSMTFHVDFDRTGPADSILHVAPISHGSGLYALPVMARGGTQVFPESMHYRVPETVDLLNRWGRATVFLAPTMVKRLVDAPEVAALRPGALKTIAYGGAPMYVGDLKRALDALGDVMVQLYGQGESPMTITCLSREHHAERAHPRWEARLASAGLPQSCVEVRTVDESGADVPVGEIGEIVVRGDTVMKGYWRNPEATAKALRDGWLWTGDMGSFDADGFLTLKDRSKDMIISGGSNIYPREVEDVLQLHPGVLECSVVGRPHPEWGEETVAWIVRRPGAEVSAAELDALCLARIARFKRPKDYRFIDALPKNNYGKILKTELRLL